MSGAPLPTGRRIGAVAVGIVVLLIAALVGQILSSIVGVGFRIDDPRIRAAANLIIMLATLVLAARVHTTTVAPRFAPDYQRLQAGEARRITIATGVTLGGLLLVLLPLLAPPEVGALSLATGPLVAAATIGGALLAPRDPA